MRSSTASSILFLLPFDLLTLWRQGLLQQRLPQHVQLLHGFRRSRRYLCWFNLLGLEHSRSQYCCWCGRGLCAVRRLREDAAVKCFATMCRIFCNILNSPLGAAYEYVHSYLNLTCKVVWDWPFSFTFSPKTTEITMAVKRNTKQHLFIEFVMCISVLTGYGGVQLCRGLARWGLLLRMLALSHPTTKGLHPCPWKPPFVETTTCLYCRLSIKCSPLVWKSQQRAAFTQRHELIIQEAEAYILCQSGELRVGLCCVGWCIQFQQVYECWTAAACSWTENIYRCTYSIRRHLKNILKPTT